MSSSGTTSAVEDVGSGEQGNIQTQGESNLGTGRGTSITPGHQVMTRDDEGAKNKNNTHSYKVKITNQNKEEHTAHR